MARLPQVGGDSGSWGDILNDYLSQAHDSDGKLKSDSVGAPQLKPLGVTNAALANDTIQEVKFDAAVRAKLNAPAPALADGSVTTEKLANGAVTPEKVDGFGSADGFATLGVDGRLPEAEVPDRLSESGLSATIHGAITVALDSLEGGNAAATVHSQLPARLSVSAAVAEKAKSGVATVALYGMSIAQADSSAVQMMGALLQREFGLATSTNIQAFLLGGSYENAQAGWVKQRSSGPGYGRAVGDNLATPRTYTGFGDKIVVLLSREADSVASDITIDGAVVGQTPPSGAQNLVARQEFAVTRAHHSWVIPAASAPGGKVYFVRTYIYDSETRGVLIIDDTLGGSTLGNMVSVSGKSGAQIDPIATVGDAGITAHFDRDDIDAFALQQDVNDAGSPPTGTYIDDVFVPTLNKIIAITKAKRKPLLLVSSMAGHYAMPNDAGSSQRHTNYERIRAIYAEAAAENNHITHLDWHEANRMDDFDAYAARYYTTVAGLNVPAGTYTGDFIHPDVLGHKEGHSLVARAVGTTPPQEDSAANVRWEIQRRPPRTTPPPAVARLTRLLATTVNVQGTGDTITFPTPHSLVVGDQISVSSGISGVTGLTGGVRYYVVAVPDASTVQVSTTAGGAVLDIGGANAAGGASVYGYVNRKLGIAAGMTRRVAAKSGQWRMEPYYRDPSAVNLLAATQATIDASPLSDQYGRYIEVPTLQNPGLASRIVNGERATLTIRASGTIEIRTNSTHLITPVDDSAGASATANIGTVPGAPIVTSLVISTTAANQFISWRGGRVYEISLVHGSVPILI